MKNLMLRRLMTVFAIVLFSITAHATDLSTADYELGADDVIQIMVSNHDEFNTTATIRPDGKITLAKVNDVVAAGITAKALAARLQKAYSPFFKNYSVTVMVKEVHSRRARIVGAVKASGTYELKANWRVMDLVAVAGGLSTKPVRITGRVVRSGRIIPVDVEQANAHPDSIANVLLRADDLVLLDAEDVTRQVTVIGQVNKPGAYDLDEGLTPVSLVAEAGGVLPAGALSKAYVLRGSTQYPLNLYSVLIDGLQDPKITGWKFVAGDALVIPEIVNRYGVMGEVSKADYYPFPEKTSDATVLKALARAGGQVPTGDLRKASLSRVVAGKATNIPVNIEALLKGNAADIALMPNDVLYIPVSNNQVTVSGQVERQGAYKLSDNTTIMSILGEAGGVKQDTAAPSKAYIERDGKRIPVPLQTATEPGAGNKELLNFKLQAGDVLVVPESEFKYAVWGEVRTAGAFHFPDKGVVTVTDALTAAGGQLPSANLNNAGIFRKVNGEDTVIPVKFNTKPNQGQPSASLVLQPNDILFIPTKKDSPILKMLGPLAAMGRLFF